MPRELDETVDVAVEADPKSSVFFAPLARPLPLTVHGATHAGRVRSENQDHFLVARRIRSQQILCTSLPLDETTAHEQESYTLLVADGVAGTTIGELASRMVALKIWELSWQATSWLMRLGESTSNEPHRRIQRYADELQQMFEDYAAIAGPNVSLGTTCTCAAIMNQDVVIAHIGDCRTYLLRDGRLQQMTRDHTVEQALLDAGQNTAEARVCQHVLTRALGTEGHDSRLDVIVAQVRSGDRLLLCSDGLTREVPDDEIGRQLGSHDSAQAVCERLIALALDRGGRDNITAIVAKFGEP